MLFSIGCLSVLNIAPSFARTTLILGAICILCVVFLLSGCQAFVCLLLCLLFLDFLEVFMRVQAGDLGECSPAPALHNVFLSMCIRAGRLGCAAPPALYHFSNDIHVHLGTQKWAPEMDSGRVLS